MRHAVARVFGRAWPWRFTRQMSSRYNKLLNAWYLKKVIGAFITRVNTWEADDRLKEPEIGIVFPSIWSEGNFDPSDQLEACNTRLLNPIWSEICWSSDNSTETPDLPSESVRTEPDDSCTLSLWLVSSPHLSWWPGKWCSRIDLESVTPLLWHLLGSYPVLPCPPEHSFPDWKSVEKDRLTWFLHPFYLVTFLHYTQDLRILSNDLPVV